MNDRDPLKVKKLAYLPKKKHKHKIHVTSFCGSVLKVSWFYSVNTELVSHLCLGKKNVLDCFVLYCFISNRNTLFIKHVTRDKNVPLPGLFF